MRPRTCTALVATIILSACAAEPEQTSTEPYSTESAAPAQEHQQIERGNGENNYIILDGAVRDGATFTFKEVAIDAPGWLVTHPFENGAPVATVYTGATLLAKGVSTDVQITVTPEPAPGDMMIVMLHYDVNDDGVFDFNDGVTVPDAPVFEDGVLIALRYTTE